jgi:hypothetical protein
MGKEAVCCAARVSWAAFTVIAFHSNLFLIISFSFSLFFFFNFNWIFYKLSTQKHGTCTISTKGGVVPGPKESLSTFHATLDILYLEPVPPADGINHFSGFIL